MKHCEDFIRVRFKEYKDMPFYPDDNVLYFDNFESVKNWMKVKFRDLEVESVVIDIIEIISYGE